MLDRTLKLFSRPSSPAQLRLQVRFRQNKSYISCEGSVQKTSLEYATKSFWKVSMQTRYMGLGCAEGLKDNLGPQEPISHQNKQTRHSKCRTPMYAASPKSTRYSKVGRAPVVKHVLCPLCNRQKWQVGQADSVRIRAFLWLLWLETKHDCVF